MIAICSDPSLGDAIMAMAALQIIVTAPDTLYLECENKAAQLYFAPDGWRPLGYFPAGAWQRKVIHLNIGKSMELRGRYAHPIQQFVEQAGYEIDGVPERFGFNHFTNPTWSPELREVQTFDFVIAPYSADVTRMWREDKWVWFVHALRDQYPDCTIALVGERERIPEPWWAQLNVAYFFGRQLSSVIHLMQQCRKAVITVDSAPSRLAHVGGITNHVILSPQMYPEVWVGHPGAIQVRGSPDLWNTATILEAVEQTIAKNSKAGT